MGGAVVSPGVNHHVGIDGDSRCPRAAIPNFYATLLASIVNRHGSERLWFATAASVRMALSHYDVNKQASSAEMRAYACGQCHVEYSVRIVHASATV